MRFQTSSLNSGETSASKNAFTRWINTRQGPPGQIGLRSFQEKMVVVAHQREGMNPKPASLAGLRLRQGADKGGPVRVVPHDPLSTISARHHVIEGSWKFHPHRSRHSSFSNARSSVCQ